MSTWSKNLLGMQPLLCPWYGLLWFPICLSVQLVRPQKYRSWQLINCLKQHHICWQPLIRIYSNYHAHLDIFRSDLKQFAIFAQFSLILLSFFFGASAVIDIVVKLLVPASSCEIISCLFEHCDCKKHTNRSDICYKQSNFEEWDKLGESDKQKEHIKEVLKLIVYEKRQKCNQGVLLVIKLVSRKASRTGSSIKINFSFFFRYRPPHAPLDLVKAAAAIVLTCVLRPFLLRASSAVW